MTFAGELGNAFVVFADGEPPHLLEASRCGRTRRLDDAAELEAMLNDLVVPRQAPTVSPRYEARKALMRAVLQAIDRGRGEMVTAGSDLDPLTRNALRELLAEPMPLGPYPPGSRIRAPSITVEALRVSDGQAAVLLTLGPVPENPRAICGISLQVPIRPSGKAWWAALDEAAARCANLGVPAAVRASRLRSVQNREALLLALSYLRLSNDVTLVAGPELAPEARALLAELGPVIDRNEVTTADLVLPANHFRIDVIQFSDDLVTVEGTQGPVPRNATLSCGTGFRIRLMTVADGWKVVDSRTMEC